MRRKKTRTATRPTKSAPIPAARPAIIGVFGFAGGVGFSVPLEPLEPLEPAPVDEAAGLMEVRDAAFAAFFSKVVVTTVPPLFVTVFVTTEEGLFCAFPVTKAVSKTVRVAVTHSVLVAPSVVMVVVSRANVDVEVVKDVVEATVVVIVIGVGILRSSRFRTARAATVCVTVCRTLAEVFQISGKMIYLGCVCCCGGCNHLVLSSNIFCSRIRLVGRVLRTVTRVCVTSGGSFIN